VFYFIHIFCNLFYLHLNVYMYMATVVCLLVLLPDCFRIMNQGNDMFFEIPVVIASDETLKGYGRLVKDFQQERVEKKPWPMQGQL